MTYTQALRWLFGLQRFGIKLGLENTRRLFAALNLPSPNERILHVAGTNGKGSVCAMLDAICRAAGYRTALFTSPHLITFRERIRADGVMISAAAVARGLTSIKRLVARWDPHPTFFEITTALALDHFREKNVEIVVLETGMGGRLDATNAAQPVVSVLTPIDYDHQKWLGHSLTKIATEKAGIIKKRVPVVSSAQKKSAAAVIRRHAARRDAPLEFVRQPFTRFPIALAGPHQKHNAALAVAALRAAKISVSDDALRRGLATVQWPGRFQRWGDRTVIDGAHNPSGARVLAKTFRQMFRGKEARTIFAVLEDKDAGKILAPLAPITREFLFPAIRSPRAVQPDKLRLTSRKNHPKIPARTFSSFAEALAAANESSEPILITGSLHFAGEALAFLRAEELEDCLQ